MKKILFASGIFVLIFLSSNSFVFAQAGGNTQGPAANQAPGGNTGGPKNPPAVTPVPIQSTTTTGGPTGLDLKINNPLGVQSIEEVIQKIMAVIVKLAVPVIICFFIYAGFMFITAQGDKAQLAKAKTMFLQVIIGSVIILGAWTIAAAIVSTVNLITG